jgi:hypothetical protein
MTNVYLLVVIARSACFVSRVQTTVRVPTVQYIHVCGTKHRIYLVKKKLNNFYKCNKSLAT